MAAAVIVLASCSRSSSPRTANPGRNSGRPAATGSPATGPPQGNPVKLLNEWAACMRSHGDPDQAAPTVGAGQVIRVTQPAGYYGTMYGPTGQSDSGAGVTCQAYLTGASTALRGGQPLPQPDQAQMDAYAECMRASGVPGFRSPGSAAGSAPGVPSAAPGGAQGPRPAGNDDLKPGSPTFEKAAQVCAKKTGGQFAAGGATLPGEIELLGPDGGVSFVVF